MLTEGDYPPEASSIIGQYIVSMLDRGDEQYKAYAVWVTRTSPFDEERWIVQSHYGTRTWRSTKLAEVSYLGKGNHEWINRYTFTLTEAFRLAWEVAAIVTINGRTVWQVLEIERVAEEAEHGHRPD